MKRGLGNRGLKTLLSEQSSADGLVEDTILISQLQSGKYQPRKNWDQESLNELATSINKQGIIQPILIRKIDAEKYEIVAGERRWRAAKLAGLTKVPVVIKELSDQDALAIALIENIQRQDLNVIEEALAMQQLIEEFSLSHQELANNLGKTRTVVSNNLRLLQLDKKVQLDIQTNKLSMGHARALIPLQQNQQVLIAQKIIAQNMTVRQVEVMVKNLLQSTEKITESTDMKYNQYATKLAEQLSTKVNLKTICRINADGKGELCFKINSLNDLEVLINRF